MLVISPFSRGGHIATEVFDHTSQLKLVSERFGVEVPNVSAWRRKKVGDLTSTLFHVQAERRGAQAAAYLGAAAEQRAVPAVEPGDRERRRGAEGADQAAMPKQGGGSQPASYYFRTTKADQAIPDDAETEVVPPGPRPMTTKSSYNRLAKVS